MHLFLEQRYISDLNAATHQLGHRSWDAVRRCGHAQYGPDMADEDGYFGERIAASYDESVADMARPDVVGPAVDLRPPR